MNVELPYGERTLTVTLPARTRLLSNTETMTLPPVDDLHATVRAALEHPLGRSRIRELVRPGAHVTIAFDDATVTSYGPIRGVAIRAVLDELAAAGVSRRHVTLICANALHRMLRRTELARIIGQDLVDEFADRLLCHDAEDPASLVDLGETPEHGYPVEVHRLVADSALTVYVNAGYIRGFNGGWKSVCVGLSTYRSIRVTHTPDGMSMAVHANRMHTVLARWAGTSSGDWAGASSRSTRSSRIRTASRRSSRATSIRHDARSSRPWLACSHPGATRSRSASTSSSTASPIRVPTPSSPS